MSWEIGGGRSAHIRELIRICAHRIAGCGGFFGAIGLSHALNKIHGMVVAKKYIAGAVSPRF